MNITRDNYESFFILYLDKELSQEEMLEVDAFIAGHPDLLQEFMKFKEVLFQPEEQIIFNHKTQILRYEGLSIEEKMLLFLDRELSGPEADQLQKQIDDSELLTSEWEVLKGTRLHEDEVIVFKDKAILYRKVNERVISGKFIKWAIAAAFIGAAIMIGIRLNNLEYKADQHSIALQQPKRTAIPLPKPSKPAGKQDSPVPATKAMPKQVEVKREPNKPIADNYVAAATTKKIVAGGRVASVSRPKLKPEPSLEETKLFAKNKNTEFNTKIDNPLIEQKITSIKPEERIGLTDVNTLNLPKNSLATTAVFTNEKSENRILFMNEDNMMHSRAGSLFRRIKRTVERKTKINTGNSLKIAGFEIAIN